MGIRNFIAEFQDYFYVRRSIIERLDENSLSSSNIEVAYKQTEDIVEDFMEFMGESESDSMKVLLAEFGDDLSDEEVRMLRIKFISDVAN